MTVTIGQWARGRLALVVVALLIVTVSILQTSPGRSILTSLGLTPLREAFLELYFSNPGANPSEIETPGGPVTVAFVVSSKGGTASGQRWQIEVDNGAGPQVRAEGSVDLADGESQEITRSVNLECARASEATSRVSVRVALTGQPQEILFWVTCTGGR